MSHRLGLPKQVRDPRPGTSRCGWRAGIQTAAWVWASTLLILALLLSPAGAQEGDRTGEDQPENWLRFRLGPAPVLSPSEALDTFRLAPGFRLELVAAEPLVEDPVAMAWDPEGRLWVVEMRGFMPDVDGKGEGAAVGQVVVLEDQDGDGTMDESTVFLDRLVNPRALAVVKDGVLIGEPPNLWYCQDQDADRVCDHKKRVAAYGDPDLDQLEHTENGLIWALDNWIYNAKSARRFRFRKGQIVEQSTAFRGQWGMAQDDEGRLYYNTNSRYLSADFFPSAYLDRNPAVLAEGKPRRGIHAPIVDDESVYPIRANPGINRGYRRGMLRQDGRLARTTAVSGVAIYRGGQFPEAFVGDAFVPEPAGNVVSHFKVWQEGVELRAEKVLYDDPEWGQREFLASTDERFRPVNCALGPDGALYVVDMYRGILQHRRFVTTYLRRQILERKLDAPLGLGRIYRVAYDGELAAVRTKPPSTATAAGRLEALSHPNGWWRDTAQRLLVEESDPAMVPALRGLATGGESGMGRVHAMWTLHGQGAADEETVLSALADPEPQVRIAGLRGAEPLLETPAHARVLPRLLALLDDGDPGVRLQAAFSLGELGEEPRARAALVQHLWRQRDDAYHRQAVLSGLAGAEIEILIGLLDASPDTLAPETGGHGRRAVVETLTAAALRRDPVRLDDLLERIAAQSQGPAWRQIAMLDGILEVWEDEGLGRHLHRPPSLFDLDVGASALGHRITRLREAVAGFERSLAARAVPLTPRQERLLRRGERLYATCQTCHQADGRGQAGEAPSLVNSPWILEGQERLIRIVLHGLQGPLVVDGEEWDTVMPGHIRDRNFTNKNVAGLLTYVRRQWGHRATPVDPRTVAQIRKSTKGRRLPWTVDELLALD